MSAPTDAEVDGFQGVARALRDAANEFGVCGAYHNHSYGEKWPDLAQAAGEFADTELRQEVEVLYKLRGKYLDRVAELEQKLRVSENKLRACVSGTPACSAHMSLNDYQIAALRTANTARTSVEEPTPTNLATWALGVAGEAGEVADLYKKHIGHGHPLDPVKVCKELGDVLWYVAVLAKSAGYTLEQVAQANVDKLKKRYPNGFSSEASRNRADE